MTVTDSQTGAAMTVDYAPTGWGTLMKVQVQGLTAGTDCQFVVVDSAGHRWTVGGWRVNYSGGPAWYPASTAVADKDLRTFELVSGHRVLAEVPAA